MKLAVFNDYRLGLVEGTSIFDVTDALDAPPRADAPYFINDLIASWERLAPRLQDARARAPALDIAQVRLLSPNPAPRHIAAAPANYRKHVEEMGELRVTPPSRTALQQGFFFKSSGSVIGASQSIELPRGSMRRFDHESELGVVIGSVTRNVSREDALRHVFGYTCLIDVTMRIVKGKGEEERVMRKSLDTFTPMGPWIVTADEIADPQVLSNELFVNGEPRQRANTRDMLVGVAELIELVSAVMTLYPGDVIASGTPEGIGPLMPGDNVTIRISEIGEMTVPVRETSFTPRHLFDVT